MAQTVALQRGTTSVSANNTSSVTLFTQSGGTATRVILNSLNMTFSPTPSTGTQSIIFFVTSSGGQSAVLGVIRSLSQSVALQFTPAGSPMNQFMGISPGGTTSTIFPPAPNLTSNSTSGVGAANASAVSVTYYANNSGLPLNMVSSNFYIGPSDVVSIKAFAQYNSGKSTPSSTMSISYSFTTITES